MAHYQSSSSCQECSEEMGMRRRIKEETCSSLVLPHPSLHPVTLSDWLHLIPSFPFYRLLAPGTVLKVYM